MVWDQRDPFDGEDEPPVTVTWPWPAATATVTDAFGQAQTAEGRDGQIRLPVSRHPRLRRGMTSWPRDKGPGRAGRASILSRHMAARAVVFS